MKENSGKKILNDIKNTDDRGELFKVLIEVMRRLRSRDGCVWDREQDHKSIKRNLIEETYEAVESIDNNDDAGLKEELGDLLLQVVFHSQIAEEEKSFEINDVLRIIIQKLVRRHPHVFGGTAVSNSKEVLLNWEDIKKKEREESQDNKEATMFSKIPKMLPSLHYANEIQSRAARLGFDWDNHGDVFEKIKEELQELEQEMICSKKNNNRISDEIGDMLFSIVNLCRHLGLDSEDCLDETSQKFISRFNYMQKYSEENNLDFVKLPLEEKERIWKIAKKELLD